MTAAGPVEEASRPAAPASTGRPRRRWLPGLLTLLLPGAGQVWVGRPLRGVVLLAAWTVGVLAATQALLHVRLRPVNVLGPFVALAVAYVWIWTDAVWCAYRTEWRQPRLRFPALVLFCALGLAGTENLLDVVRSEVVEAFKIPNASMSRTLEPGDRLLCDKLAYRGPWGRDPERGDLVVYRSPLDAQTVWVRRVIGIPGDVIGPVVVSPGYFLVLADGLVPREAIVGRAAVIFYSEGREGIRWTRVGLPL